jgi:ATP-dependent Zn protease
MTSRKPPNWRARMSKSLGNLTYGIAHQSRFLKTSFASEERNYSEHTSEQIDGEVRGIIDRIYSQVRVAWRHVARTWTESRWC